MTPSEFCIWLDGVLEANAANGGGYIDSSITTLIIDKLAKVERWDKLTSRPAVQPLSIEDLVKKYNQEKKEAAKNPYGPPYDVTCGQTSLRGESNVTASYESTKLSGD